MAPTRAPDPSAVLRLERRPRHGSRHAWHRPASPTSSGPSRSWPRARHQHHGPRRDGPLRLHEGPDRRCATWTSCTRTRPTSTPRTSVTRSGPWSATPAGTSRSRPRSRSRWATAGRPRSPRSSTTSRSACPRTWRRPRRRPVHPDARDLRLGTGTQAPVGVGCGPRRPRGIAGWRSPRGRCCAGPLGGAEVAGIADRTGSITPGKKADIVIIDGSAVNVAPIIDPVGAVVCAADISNVKTVSRSATSSSTSSGWPQPSRERRSRRRATICSRSSASPRRAG